MSSLSADLIQKYVQGQEKALGDVIDLYKKGSWTQIKQDGDLRISSTSYSNSPFSVVKGEVVISKPFESVLKASQYVKVVDSSTPEAERSGFSERKFLVDNPESQILYTAILSGQVHIPNIDFLLFRKLYEKDGLTILLYSSIENADLKPVVEGYSRGFTTFQAFVLEKDGGNVKLTVLVHADPKVAIPAEFYQALTIKQVYVAQIIKSKIP